MYYQGSSEIQGDGLQTLYLMNPSFTGGYNSDAQQQQQPAAAAAAASNMVILNYAAAAGNSLNFASISSSGQQQTQTQHLVGVPLQATAAGAGIGSSINSHDLKLNHLSMHNLQHELPTPSSRGSVIPHFHPGLWGSLDHHNSTGGGDGGGGGGGSPSHHHQHIPTGVVVSSHNPVDVGTQLGFHRPTTTTQQGLSLTLSSSQQPPGYRGTASTLSMDQTSVQTPIGILSPRNPGENLRGLSGTSSSVSAVSNGITGMQSAVFGSKYLKVAQQLLDELVSVGKGRKSSTDMAEKGGKEKGKLNRETTVLTAGETSQVIGQSDTKGSSPPAELTVAQRQELQMKKAKLVSMLDEVEQRYRQYHHQMQIVVASFEQAAGIGSAKSYTQLALQTISKQFRCLKDAISSQIKSASKRLGEDQESSLGGKFEGGSRLKFVDQQLRQQRALQQLGMMQNNTWRPQRGLPERAVSVLRAWLFEHFLHPYPKDSDKQMLAKQTGLTRSQVSNWFINARVRLWKPMVEEMYLEETKNQELHGSESNKESESNSKNPKENNNAARIDQRSALQSKQLEKTVNDATLAAISTSSLASSPTNNTSPQAQQAGFGLLSALNMEGNAQKNSKKMRTDQMQNSPSSILSADMDMKFGDTRRGFNNGSQQRQTTKDSFSLMVNNTSATTHGNGFGSFTLGELGQFNPEQLTPTGFHGNSVSLTLGLPPSENLGLSGSHDQQNYLSVSDQNIQLGGRREMGGMEGHFDHRVNKSQPSHSNMGYEAINFDNRKRFAAQLLPDFVT